MSQRGYLRVNSDQTEAEGSDAIWLWPFSLKMFASKLGLKKLAQIDWNIDNMTFSKIG